MGFLKRSLASLLGAAILFTQVGTNLPKVNAVDDAPLGTYTIGESYKGGTIVDIYKNRTGSKEYPVIKYTAESSGTDKVNITMYKPGPFRTSNTFESGENITSDQYIVPDGDFQEWKQANEVNTNAKGLLRIDENGYYYYNSANTHASYDKESNEFTLYDNLLVGWDSYGGNFYPYHQVPYVEGLFASGYVSKGYCNDGRPRYNEEGKENYFGIKMEVDFLQNVGGKMANGEDMVFEFNGDDAVFVYIDDVLILNAGNTGYKDTDISTINFATGAVYENHRYLGITNTSLRERFARAGYTEEQLNSMFIETEDGGYRFADLTSHKLKMFYCDDGAVYSRLNMKFSISPIETDDIITVTKKVEGDINPDIVSDVSFQYRLYLDDTIAAEGTSFDILKNGFYTGKKGTVEKGGIFTLKDGQSAQFDATNVTTYCVQEIGVIYGSEAEGSLIFEYPESSAITGNGTIPINISKFKYGEKTGYTTDKLYTDKQANLLFTNHCSETTPSTLKITKKISDGSLPDQQFTIRVNIGDMMYGHYYTGKYTIGDTEYVAEGGKVMLRAGETAVIKGIPVGTSYYVSESDVLGVYVTPSYIDCEGDIQEGGSEAIVINNLPKKEYTLTYHPNGGVGDVPIDTNKYSIGSYATLATTSGGCTKRGSFFAGWSLTPDGTTPLSNVRINGNTTVYAIWRYATYLHVFTQGGGKCTVLNETTTMGGSRDSGITEHFYDYAPIEADETLIELYSANVTNAVAINVKADEGYTIGAIAYKDYHNDTYRTVYPTTGDVTLSETTITVPNYTLEDSSSTTIKVYVEFVKKPFKLTYDANGGIGSVPVDSKEYSDGEIASLDPTSGGCHLNASIFLGWSLEKGDNNKDSIITEVEMTANTTVYAVWADGEQLDVFTQGEGTFEIHNPTFYLTETSNTGVTESFYTLEEIDSYLTTVHVKKAYMEDGLEISVKAADGYTIGVIAYNDYHLDEYRTVYPISGSDIVTETVYTIPADVIRELFDNREVGDIKVYIEFVKEVKHSKDDWYVRCNNPNLVKGIVTGVKDYVQYLLASNQDAFELGVQGYSWKFDTDDFDIDLMPDTLPLTITEKALTEKILAQLAEDEGALYLHTEYDKKLPGTAEIEYNAGWAQALEECKIYKVNTDGELEFMQNATADIYGFVKFNVTHGGEYILVNTQYSRAEETYNTGDINHDGIIDGADVALVNAYILNSNEFTDAQILALDCNGDNKVNVLDRSYIMSRILY